jgi:hypothetical protein
MNSSAMRTPVSLFDCYIVVTIGWFALSARLKLNNTGQIRSYNKTGYQDIPALYSCGVDGLQWVEVFGNTYDMNSGWPTLCPNVPPFNGYP